MILDDISRQRFYAERGGYDGEDLAVTWARIHAAEAAEAAKERDRKAALNRTRDVPVPRLR